MQRPTAQKTVAQLMVATACMLMWQLPTIAAENDADTSAETVAASGVNISEFLAMLNDQQAQLDRQRAEIAGQKELIDSLRENQDDELKSRSETIAKQNQQIDDQREMLLAMQTQLDQQSEIKPEELSDEDVELRSRLETLEESIANSRDASDTAFDKESFPNSMAIPGSNAALRTGGFVKMNIIESFDPLGTDDRFIAGSIPVPQQESDPSAAMTVSQSRLNWDLRDQTEYGVMRAFIEADFAGVGDTFRLRHAFGQYRDILAGKTDSTFMDSQASPEELDFEGINGRINVRQPEIRYFPVIGKDLNMRIALEAPDPQVTGGAGISQWPDIVTSLRRIWFDSWHVQTSLIFRQITATWIEDPAVKDKETGWGISISGKTATQFWNPVSRNSFMFQINYGEGYGRYVNDLGEVRGQDAVFNPMTGEMSTLPVFSGYLAYQHWWREDLRSTFNASWVEVDNEDFQAPDSYNKTLRAAANLIWSPIPRIDLGAELIWGERKNKDYQRATASQLQLSSKYRF
jgi:hypothetical protein